MPHPYLSSPHRVLETLALVNFPAVARGRPKPRRGAPEIRLGELGLPVEGIDLVWA
jgi:hypothetical protein